MNNNNNNISTILFRNQLEQYRMGIDETISNTNEELEYSQDFYNDCYEEVDFEYHNNDSNSTSSRSTTTTKL